MGDKPSVADLLKGLAEQVLSIQGSDEWLEYLKRQAEFHRYSAYNVWLIILQRPDATQVAGYRTWQRMGRQVRKGEKAIRILAPCARSAGPKRERVHEWERDMEAWREEHARAAKAFKGSEGSPELRPMPRKPQAVQMPASRFRDVCVFDVAQTDGEDLMPVDRSIRGEADGEAWEALVALARQKGYEVELGVPDEGAEAEVSPGNKRIVVKATNPPAKRLQSLAHELGHVLCGHTEPEAMAHLDRETGEFEAESVAYVVATWLGLDAAMHCASYVASWSQTKEFVDKLKSIARNVQRAAHEIIAAVEGGQPDPEEA